MTSPVTPPTQHHPPVAVVAGGSRGLGLEICRVLASRGWLVHVLARDAAELDRAATLVGEESAAVTPHVGDVRDAESVRRVVDDVLAAEGRIDAAFHVAGVIQVGELEGLTLGHYREAIDTMLWGPIHLAHAVLPSMRAAGRGRIGIVSSVGGLVAVPRLLPYSVAKFGAVGLAEGLAAGLSGTGVSATSVTPWLMRTGGHTHARFTGAATRDDAWFAPGASLPLLSVPVERAARRIIDGVLAGRPLVGASPLVWIARRVHGIAPATTIRALGLATRALPGAGPARQWTRADAPQVEGREVRRGRLMAALTTLGRRAARRQNELS